MGYNAQTALQCAARQGDIATLETLLNKPGIDVDTLNTIGKTPLHYAKDAATVQLLLAHGATVHAFDKNDRTPLYTAALAGRHAAVQALLKAGANAQEALQRAAKGGYTRAFQALLNAGADAQVALWHAARTNDEITLQTFINAGNAVEEKEEQAPWPAYAKAALELIRGKVNIHAKDKDGYTPLHTAAKAGNTAKVWALIAKGADINAKNNDPAWTPLHWAAYCGHEAVATLLIANGADINAKTTWRYSPGSTPLHLAARNGHTAVAALLIAKGADINAKDNSGETPLRKAAQNGHKEVVALLRKHGGR